MLLLGLILAGLGLATFADFGGSSGSGDSEEGTGEVTSRPITRAGEEGMLLEGTESSDAISGTDGPDILSGEDGHDTLRGQSGVDYLLGGDGDDALFGQGGNDSLFGGDGDDALHGGRGSDTLLGAGGNDSLYGGGGDDHLVGANIHNRDMEIADRYSSEDPSSPLEFDTPSDDEANLLDGGDGDDSILMGEGATATGGAGSDHFEVGHWVEDESNVPVVTDFNEEDDTLWVYYPEGDPAPTITLNRTAETTQGYADGQLVVRVQGDGGPFFAEDVRLCAFSVSDDEASPNTLTIDGVETAVRYGSEDNDTITGNNGNDILVGYEGDDSLRGSGGDDIIHGFSGDDFISGGDGNDLLIGSQGADTLKGNDGDDMIDGTVLFTTDEFLDALYSLESYGGELPTRFYDAPMSDDGDVIKGGGRK